jgi:hypothetical protein
VQNGAFGNMDARELDEELLVVARELGPPWVYVGEGL